VEETRRKQQKKSEMKWVTTMAVAMAMALYFTVHYGCEFREVNGNNTERQALSPMVDAKGQRLPRGSVSDSSFLFYFSSFVTFASLLLLM